MSTTDIDPGTMDLYASDVATLNALVTYALENMPGEPSRDMRQVARIVGRWALGGSVKLLADPPRSNNPGAAQVGRDDAIARLCDRLTTLTDRELMREDNTFVVREELREELDSYIRDAYVQKVRVQRERADPDPVTRLVHLDGGIDALQEIRERLLGQRLDVRVTS